MIILIVLAEKQAGGRIVQVTSHGVDRNTLENVVLPQEDPRALGATWNTQLQEWVLT